MLTMVSQFRSNFLGNLWGRGSCAGAVLERRRAQGGKPIAAMDAGIYELFPLGPRRRTAAPLGVGLLKK